MKKIVVGLLIAVASMSASAVQCIVNMKNGTQYVRNQTNCVTTQYASTLPTHKLIRNAVILAGVTYLIMKATETKKTGLKNSFTGEDEGEIEYIPFEGQQPTEEKVVVNEQRLTCPAGLFGFQEGDRIVCK